MQAVHTHNVSVMQSDDVWLASSPLLSHREPMNLGRKKDSHDNLLQIALITTLIEISKPLAIRIRR